MELTKEHLGIIKNDPRYKNFTICESVKNFCDMPEFDKDISLVQLHSIEIIGHEQDKSIIGFCGCFAWKEHIIVPLDGDTYTSKMPVFGYNWFNTETDGLCLDILVGDEW